MAAKVIFVGNILLLWNSEKIKTNPYLAAFTTVLLI